MKTLSIHYGKLIQVICEVEVEAETKEEAIKLYENGEFITKLNMLMMVIGMITNSIQLRERLIMELSKDQMKYVIRELEKSYYSKAYDDEHLEEIINLFKNYLKGGESK